MCRVALGYQPRFPTKDAPIKDEQIMVAVFHISHMNGERNGTPPGNGGRSKRLLDRRGLVGSILVSIGFFLEKFERIESIIKAKFRPHT